MLIDTHCHLDAAEFDGDRAAVVKAAARAGVGGIVVPGVMVDGFLRQKAVCAEYPGCHAAYGIHPLSVARSPDDDLARLHDWVLAERPLAIGEIGLDRYVDDPDPARQHYFFEAQLRLARDIGLPVILHVRRAVDAVLAALRRIEVPGGIAHAFNGSRQQAAAFIARGFALGYGGALTYPGSTRIRHLAATLPAEALVLETDAPDMAPCWRRGERNAPGEVAQIVRELAALRGEPVDELAARTAANARRVLPGLGAAAPGNAAIFDL